MNAEEACTCSYMRADGSLCSEPAEGDGDLCFWHDPEVSKEGADVKERLQEWSQSGKSMEGFVLRFARLEGIRLADFHGFNLSKAVLFRARLQGASMFNIDLRGTNLMKADFSGANLNEAKLQDANLLGAVLDGSKLERVEWGEKALQEQKAIAAEKAGEREEAKVNYEEAEEIYRSLRRAYDSAGRFSEVGYFGGVPPVLFEKGFKCLKKLDKSRFPLLYVKHLFKRRENDGSICYYSDQHRGDRKQPGL